ncbi:MAG: hypothetical protein K6G52_05520 [Treponemataceae bacterium]|nr:hypothetical protein [Treponemataceae bacterium]
MKKYSKLCIISAFLLVFSFWNLFSYDGIMSGQKKLKSLETKYFRIIYSSESETSASILFENADEIYEKIASFYGRKIQYKMPVVITSKVEQMNAYWTSYPYNHIVLYDTYCVESLTVFKENLLSVFTHELTHAFTFNMKGPFWYGFDKFFGDSVNFSALWVTGGIAEGATVFTESYLNPGEGRLNDEFTRHFVKQSKLENKFPSFFDCQGARNAYPYGVFYIYNGMFTEFLYHKYGMEKYADFWYRLVNGKTLSVQMAFKKVYGNTLKNEWKAFENSVDVSSIKSEGEFASLGIETIDSKINNRSQTFGALCASDDGLFVLNGSDYSVWKLAPDGNSKKVLCVNDIQEISVSSDSKYLAFSFFSSSSPTIRSKIGIYDTEKKVTFVLDQYNLFDPAIFFDRGAYYLAATTYSDSHYSTIVFQLEQDDSGFVKNARQVFLMEHELNSLVFDYNFEGGRLSFVKQTDLQFSFCSVERDEVRQVLLPDLLYDKNFRLRHVSYSDDLIYFTWTQKNSMERLGYYDAKNKKLYLDESDVSGGVYYPVEFDGGKIAYVGKFFDGDVVYWREAQSAAQSAAQSIGAAQTAGATSSAGSLQVFDVTERVSTAQKTPKPREDGKREDDKREDDKREDEDREAQKAGDTSAPQDTGERYCGAPYYLKGINFPLSLVSSESYSLPFGFTHISSNPWSSSNLTLSAGYGIATNSFGFLGKYSSGTATSLFAYDLALTSEFDFTGWKREEFEGNLSSSIPFGKHSSFSFALSSSVDYGKINSNSPDYSFFKLNSAVSNDSHLYLSTTDSFALSYSNLRYVGSSLHGKAGFLLSSYIYYVLKLCAPYDYQILDQRYEAGFTAKFYSPGFEPYAKDSNLFEYTVPFKLMFSVLPSSNADVFLVQTGYLLPSTSLLSSLVLLSYSAQFTLFSMQVQKAFPFFTFLYVNNFSVYLTSYGLAYDTNPSESSFHFLELPDYFSGNRTLLQNYFAGIRVECTFSPNIGQTTNSGVIARLFADISAQVYASSTSYPFLFSFGLSSSY